MDDAVSDYVAAIAPTHRPLFDRLQALILEVHPGAGVVMSYRMPTYTVGRQRLYVGVWRHGLSLYGWDRDRAQAFVAAHPELVTSKGTIKIGLSDAGQVTDDQLRDLVHAALDD